ncbi:uncharacterized protein LOC143899465 isoform X1 [Temnothorax americanus]|uniref:uncharacterized protein LOC143899465 isoform X1 n=1 Tax=Temnothorax americanus TaxID=1964332 RepID=UPI0040680AB9
MHDFTQMQNIQNLTEITDFSQCNIVVFDLETAGFAKSDEILQIAAYVENETFSVYISPTQLISKTATAVTGLHAMSGELYLHGTKMISTSATDAVNQFISFLRKYDQCLLIAHNCFKFDAPRLIKLIEKVGLMQAFSSCVKGFANSLEISKCVLPERVKEKQKFSIASLAQDFLPSFDVQNLHNAIEDVKILHKIIEKLNISKKMIVNNAKSIYFLLQKEENKLIELQNKSTLLEYKNNVSSHIILRMSKAGINKSVLQQTYEKNGVDGLRILLSQSIDGKPRITNNKRVIDKICDIFTLQESCEK